MGRKAWDDHAKFVVCSWTHFQEALSNIQMLLRTAISTAAISYNSGKPRVDAETVGDNWPEDVAGERPSARAIRDNFNAMMKHAKDVDTLKRIKDEVSEKEESEDVKGSVKKEACDTNPADSPKTPPATPAKKSKVKVHYSSNGKNSTAGIKRNRSGRNVSEDEMASDNETSSGSESEVDTPTNPASRRILPARAGRPILPPFEADETGIDDGAKDFGSDGSDPEYNFRKVRHKKAAEKKKAAAAARWAAKRAALSRSN